MVEEDPDDGDGEGTPRPSAEGRLSGVRAAKESFSSRSFFRDAAFFLTLFNFAAVAFGFGFAVEDLELEGLVA